MGVITASGLAGLLSARKGMLLRYNLSFNAIKLYSKFYLHAI
jgi:hypothetical protein